MGLETKLLACILNSLFLHISFSLPSRPYRYFVYTLFSILAFYACHFLKR